jgi:hypothetical protein
MYAVESKGGVEPIELDQCVGRGCLAEVPDMGVNGVVDARFCDGSERGRNCGRVLGRDAWLNQDVWTLPERADDRTRSHVTCVASHEQEREVKLVAWPWPDVRGTGGDIDNATDIYDAAGQRAIGGSGEVGWTGTRQRRRLTATVVAARATPAGHVHIHDYGHLACWSARRVPGPLMVVLVFAEESLDGILDAIDYSTQEAFALSHCGAPSWLLLRK